MSIGLVYAGHEEPTLYPADKEVPMKTARVEGMTYALPVSPTHGVLGDDPSTWQVFHQGMTQDGKHVVLAITNFTIQFAVVYRIADNELVFWFSEPFRNGSRDPVSEWAGDLKWHTEDTTV